MRDYKMKHFISLSYPTTLFGYEMYTLNEPFKLQGKHNSSETDTFENLMKAIESHSRKKQKFTNNH